MQITKQVYNIFMKNGKYIIGIDVYLSRYAACFYDYDSNKRLYYKGSLTNDFGKIRLINRIDKDNRILINESLLAAELMIRFPNQVTVVGNEVLSLMSYANIPRGDKTASFYIKTFKNKKLKDISKVMLDNLLVEGKKRVSAQESLCDEGINIFDNVIKEKNVDYEMILDLEERSREFNNHSDVHLNKVEEVEKVVKQFEKLNDIFDE
jgi:hypothetical protein